MLARYDEIRTVDVVLDVSLIFMIFSDFFGHRLVDWLNSIQCATALHLGVSIVC
jgi:hypothetical protein